MLFAAFSALSPAERREFTLFVQSPFFNKKENLVSLCAHLNACLEKNEAPASEPAYRSAFPQQAFDDTKLRQANSALLALLRQYFVYREKIAGAEDSAVHLAAAYRKRGLLKHFNIALREARQQLEAQPWRHADFFAKTHDIEWEQYQLVSSDRRMGELNIQETSDSMDTAFAVRKLRLGCLALSHQAVFQAEYRLELLDAALAYAERHPEITALALYAHCYRFLANLPDAESNFKRFRLLLREQSSVLPPDELRTLYLLAINYSIKKINTIGGDWLPATLELYRGALERDLLLENGFLSRFAFNNITAIALRVGETDWAEQFILQYKPLLERQYREAIASLNLARVAYQRRDYAAALPQLQRADYKDLMNNLTAKTLQLKIYFETGELEILESHLASMKTFIRRHTAIGYHRTNYSKIVYYTQRLINLKPSESAALEMAIREEPILTEKDWLLDMLK